MKKKKIGRGGEGEHTEEKTPHERVYVFRMILIEIHQTEQKWAFGPSIGGPAREERGYLIETSQVSPDCKGPIEPD